MNKDRNNSSNKTAKLFNRSTSKAKKGCCELRLKSEDKIFDEGKILVEFKNEYKQLTKVNLVTKMNFANMSIYFLKI